MHGLFLNTPCEKQRHGSHPQQRPRPGRGHATDGRGSVSAHAGCAHSSQNCPLTEPRRRWRS